jgi:hypothetical protein
MPYSYAVYTGNGATTQFTVPFPYIRREHVFASLDYVSAVFTWVNNTTVEISPAPANGVRVEVRRVTPVNNPLVDFTDGSTLVAADLDTNALQQTYINQEQDDQFQDSISINAQGLLDAGGKRITDVGNPVNAQDAATKTYVDTFVNQTANIANNAVTTAKLADDSVTSAKIVDGTIVAADLASNAVTTAKITDANVTTAKLADGAVTSGKIADGTIVAADMAAGAAVGNIGYTPVNKAGDSMTGALAMGANKVTGVGNPTAAQDAATKSYADTTFWNKTSETIDSTEVWSNTNDAVATTAAVNARIVDLLNDIGSYEVVASEVTFPNAGIVDGAGQPDAGVLVAVTDATGLTWNGSGTSTNATRVNGSAVTITGITGTSPITNCGMQVLSTSTLHTYTFVRFTVGTTVAQLISDNINEILLVDTNAAAAAASQTAAANSASAASSSASAASGSASAAATSASNAATSLSTFRGQYLGAAASPPSVDGNGNALTSGDLYFDTAQQVMRVWNGSAWVNTGGTIGLIAREAYTATNGQVNFNYTAGYDTGFVEVYLNGAKLMRPGEYTVDTSNSRVVLVTGATAGDEVEVIAYAGIAAIEDAKTAAAASATAAANSATAASNSATASANSATAASGSATAAANSATAAAGSATSALNSATAASSLVETINNLDYLLNWGLVTEAAGVPPTDYGAL